MKKIVLVVDGIDLDDEATDEACAQVRSSLWMARDGVVTVTHLADGDPVQAALQLAREIAVKVPGAQVVQWYADLVGTAQIAQRVGVTTEGVRLWVTGKRGARKFPTPLGRVGSGGRTSPVWRWADVAHWFRAALLVEGDEDYPTRQQIARIEAGLASLAVPGEGAVAYAHDGGQPLIASRAAMESMQRVSIGTSREVAWEKS